MKHAIRIASAFAFAALCLCTGAGAKIVTFEIPGSAGLYVTSVNDKEQVTGWYLDDRGHGFHGFFWQRGGAPVKFDVPPPVNNQHEYGEIITWPTGISAAGVISGWYYEPNGRVTAGFVRAADGTITTYNIANFTVPGGANERGWIVGDYSPALNMPVRAFLRDPSGTTHTFPMRGIKDSIFPSVVNRSRTIAGTAAVQSGNTFLPEAFIRPAHGSATLFGGVHRNVSVAGINDAGTVVGTFLDANHVAFVRTADGTLTTFQGPNGATDTQAVGIDNSGTIAGGFWYANGGGHNFLRAADGTFTLFDIEGSVGSSISAMNGKGAVAGSYSISTGALFGFVGKP